MGPQASTTPQTFHVQNLALGAGSTFNSNQQNTQEPAGTGYDLTNVGGQLTLTGRAAAGGQIIIRLIGLDANGNQGTAASFNPAQSDVFTLVTTGSGIVGYTPGEFTVNAANFANNTQGGTFAVVEQGNNLVLVYSAVPEPSTWALLSIGRGLLGVTLRGRTRRASVFAVFASFLEPDRRRAPGCQPDDLLPDQRRGHVDPRRRLLVRQLRQIHRGAYSQRRLFRVHELGSGHGGPDADNPARVADLRH